MDRMTQHSKCSKDMLGVMITTHQNHVGYDPTTGSCIDKLDSMMRCCVKPKISIWDPTALYKPLLIVYIDCTVMVGHRAWLYVDVGSHLNVSIEPDISI